jgi:hypothetical protein
MLLGQHDVSMTVKAQQSSGTLGKLKGSITIDTAEVWLDGVSCH